jgi:hypothetical protein
MLPLVCCSRICAVPANCLLQDPPGGGLSPAAIIASYATYPYATHLPLLAVEALNAFAILQVKHIRLLLVIMLLTTVVA